MTDAQRQRREVVLFAVLFEGGLAGLAWLLGWVLDQPPLQSMHGRVRDTLVGVAATIPLLLLFLVCIRWPVGPLVRIQKFGEEVIRPLFRPCSWLELAAIALLAGLGEEMLFRGVLQEVLRRRLSLWGAVAASNLLFGLLHLITPTYAVIAGLMGVYLSCLWIASGNLLVVVVTHALYDFLALLYLVKRPVRE
jgi:membrane protease YdiL (CAAX protease family)